MCVTLALSSAWHLRSVRPWIRPWVTPLRVYSSVMEKRSYF
jgi:hypothetical protein